ncbi:MAG: carbohydrate kinase, partial [Eubacterium sp.]|nr:carbohydrate kinase [Eubacterium sp.]
EGVAYEMKVNYDALAGSGVHFQKLHATGGGAHSKVWMQMKADVLNLPITALQTVDAGTVGSAMLTGICTGAFRDLHDAASHMVQERETYQPRADMHEKYMRIYERYRKLYAAVRPLMQEEKTCL